jgi:hypothetical protein
MMRMSRTSFSQRLVAENADVVLLYLRDDIQATQQKQGEAILDLNRSGNWVRGLEMIGGFVPFSLAKAVSPFSPVRPAFPKRSEPGTVTYDAEADAAFFYLEYDSDFHSLTLQEQAELNLVSHSVNPTVVYGLDDLGGLIWVRIPLADLAGPADQFLRLLRR